MTIKKFLKKKGFVTNPFQHTNADKEIEFLEKYFIYPEYFEDIWGDPDDPVSNIIYAPRGGGKTAQRLMIEKRANSFDNILTVTYANHDLSNFEKASDVTLSYHLEYLNRLLLLSFFERIDRMHDLKYLFKFSYSERQFIFKLCRIYLFNTPVSFPKQAINSLKTFEDNATDVWNKLKAPISEIIKKITKANGLEVDISSIELDEKLKLTHKDNFENIREFLNKIGLTTIYILVDKVDEQSITGNDPKASYDFIQHLIRDLELLETPSVAFKFFLWDKLEPYCSQYARPDRVFSYKLKWESKEIETMLNQRVAAYSDNSVLNARDLFSELKGLGRVVLFSENSPRDCIRICNRVLSEQFKNDPNEFLFKSHIVNSSIDHFCTEKTKELIGNPTNIRHLSKVGTSSFTIEELVSKKVAANASAVRNVIRPWQSSDLLTKIGTVNRKNKKAVNEYAFTDIRLSRFACSTYNLNEFIKNEVKRCSSSHCNETWSRNFNKRDYDCLSCGNKIV